MNDQAFRAFDTYESGPSSLGQRVFLMMLTTPLTAQDNHSLTWQDARWRIKNCRFMLQKLLSYSNGVDDAMLTITIWRLFIMKITTRIINKWT